MKKLLLVLFLSVGATVFANPKKAVAIARRYCEGGVISIGD